MTDPPGPSGALTLAAINSGSRPNTGTARYLFLQYLILCIFIMLFSIDPKAC